MADRGDKPQIPILGTQTRIGKRRIGNKQPVQELRHEHFTTAPRPDPVVDRIRHVELPVEEIERGAELEYKDNLIDGTLFETMEQGLSPEEREVMYQRMRRETAKIPEMMLIESIATSYSFDQMKKMAVCEVLNTRETGMFSVNDTRMGTKDADTYCQTCSGDRCDGHFGLIPLNVAMYNPVHVDKIVMTMAMICVSCGGFLMPVNKLSPKELAEFNVADDDRRMELFMEVLDREGVLRLKSDRRFKALHDLCKGGKCINRDVDPCITRGVAPCPPRIQKPSGCTDNPKFMTDQSKKKGKIFYKDEDGDEMIMPICEVDALLNCISDEDAKLMGFKPEFEAHPRNMILRGILVVPPSSRPPPTTDSLTGLMRIDGFTETYINLVRLNNEILTSSDEKKKQKAIDRLYKVYRDFLLGKDLRVQSIMEMIQGKRGMFRGLLGGKTVNFCARTVLGPDPSLKFGQIRVPEVFAPVLTPQVRVNHLNINYLKKLLANGRITIIIRKGRKIKVEEGQVYTLKIGDKISRWLQDGDTIVFNRQPTLSKQSMMAYDVVLGKQLTIGLHLSATSPHNADFDGDEGNLWTLQGVEARAEAKNIMHVTNCIMSTIHNKPAIGLVMDVITGAYLLTDPKTEVDDLLFNESISIMSRQDQLNTLYERLERYNVPYRSGRALFSALLPEDFNYNHAGVLIIDGVLIQGRITKKHIGTAHRSIVQELWTNYNRDRAVDFLTDAPWLIDNWLVEEGHTVGIDDCIKLEKMTVEEEDPDTGEVRLVEKEINRNKEAVRKYLAQVKVNIESIGPKTEDPLEEEIREREIVTEVNSVKGLGTRIAKEAMVEGNRIGVMADTGGGAKGGLFNVAQIMGAVGQQFYKGKRLAPTLTRGTRCLPMFDPDDPNPEARGFCVNSFWEGLSPAEFFFHMQGGREGLMDTALKTADTGDLSARMRKALADVQIAMDGSVRSVTGPLFQYVYGADGYDVSYTMKVPTIGYDNMAAFIDVRSVANSLNINSGWVPSKVVEIIQEGPFVTAELRGQRPKLPQKSEAPKVSTRRTTTRKKPTKPKPKAGGRPTVRHPTLGRPGTGKKPTLAQIPKKR